MARWLRCVAEINHETAELMGMVAVPVARWIYEEARRPTRAPQLPARVDELLALVALRANPDAIYQCLRDWGASV